MQFLDLTLPTMAENLALDEALLDEAETSGEPQETLRLWEPSTMAVVLGRSSRRTQEVNEEACRQRKVEVLRRSSGGLSIVTGPGCLMYSVVLSCVIRPELKSITAAHQFVLAKLGGALAEQIPGVCICGTSDLTLGERKFSGNCLRTKRNHLLYHGTLLYNLALEVIAECLLHPPRSPDYRAGRDHSAFVMNLPLPVEALRQTVQAAFACDQVASSWPAVLTQQLVCERFSQEAWTNEF
jgi:lipoate---protein ligase